MQRVHKLRHAVIAAGAALSLGSGVAMGQGGFAGDVPADVAAGLENSYIFVFDHNVSAIDAPGQAQALATAAGGALQHVYTTAMKGFSAKMPAGAAARIAAMNPQIAHYEADGVARAIAPGGNAGPPTGGGGATPQVVPSGIRRVGGPVDGTGLTAWIIDTGIDLDHPDLNVDAARGANFNGRGAPDDRNGHGTHVAGTIGAIDNDVDVVGVAAGATLVPVQVLGKSGNGRISDVIAGVDFVAANAQPGDVANLSLGGGASPALDAAVIGAANAGVLFSVAAGNSGDDANNYSPARVEHPNVYTVSAVNQFDVFASFSNWGNPPVDFAAPGVNVLSTLLGGGTLTLSGTSMAAPHVAGVLLVTGGLPTADGCASGDPDGNPDPVVHIAGLGSC